MCPTVNFIDSGELATVATTLGIAHPTGYPLFTLIGWMFAHAPIGLRTIFKLNLMSGLLCAAGLFLFYKFLVFLFDEFLAANRKGEMLPTQKAFHVYLPASFGALMLGLSETYWSQAVSVEVYSLHVVFLGALLFLFAKAMYIDMTSQNGKADREPGNLYRYFFAFLLGMSFTNHMSTIFLAPAFLYLFFSIHGFKSGSWKTIAGLMLPFAIGLSVYLYLPYRASEQPLLNWGNPVDFERFFRHTSGKQYAVWLFSSTETARTQLTYFLKMLPEEFGYFALLFVPVGIWSFFKSNRKMFVFTLLLFFGCVLYAINYDIHDIDSYFLLAFVTVAIFMGAGIRYLFILRHQPSARKVILVLAVGGVVLNGWSHYSRVNLNDMRLVEEYTLDMFDSIEPNGIIISYQWDYFVSASYYLQHIEQVRTDVVVIDKELLRRSWYFKQLEKMYPWLIAQSRPEINAYLVELQKFENNLPYNPSLIENMYARLIRSFIEKNLVSRPVYVTYEIELQYTTGFQRVPSGLALRLYPDHVARNFDDPNFTFHRPSVTHNKYADWVVQMYAQAFLYHATYANVRGEKDRAMKLIDQALSIQPERREALEFKERLRKGM